MKEKRNKKKRPQQLKARKQMAMDSKKWHNRLRSDRKFFRAFLTNEEM